MRLIPHVHFKQHSFSKIAHMQNSIARYRPIKSQSLAYIPTQRKANPPPLTHVSIESALMLTSAT